MRNRSIALAVAIVAVSSSTAPAANGPPPPKAAGGRSVAVVARGVPTPTAFAFLGGKTFVAGFGDEQHPKITGGVFVLKGGKPIKLAGSPPHVFGLATVGSTLYVSDGCTSSLERLEWKAVREDVRRRHRPERFSGFNGIVVTPDGKTIYSGVSLSNGKKADYAHGITPYANDVVNVSVKTGYIAASRRACGSPGSSPTSRATAAQWYRISARRTSARAAARPAARGQGRRELRLSHLSRRAWEVREVHEALRRVPGARLADGAGRNPRQALRRALRRHRQGA